MRGKLRGLEGLEGPVGAGSNKRPREKHLCDMQRQECDRRGYARDPASSIMGNMERKVSSHARVYTQS